MPREDTQFKPGVSGNPAGRPPGVPALQAAMRKLLEDDPERFATKFGDMLDEGDATAWGLMVKRAWPEPKTEVDLNVEGPVQFSWKEPAKPIKKKAPRKKTPRKKKTGG